MKSYEAFYLSKRVEIKAFNTYAALVKAYDVFKPTKMTQHLVSVQLNFNQE